MIDEKVRSLLDRHIECGLALAAKPPEADDPIPSPAIDCPPISRIATALRQGFTPAEEEWARRSPDFQRIVQLYWRVIPVSFWMLARSLTEGARFPFVPALEAHLAECAEALAARQSPLTAKLTSRLRRIADAESWNRLQRRVLDWEAGVRRFLAPLPAVAGAFATESAEPYFHGADFDNGLSVRLEEVRHSELRVTASLPAVESAPDSFHLTLFGDSGEWIATEITLTPSGSFTGGQASLDSLSTAAQRLGRRCLVVVSGSPIPEWEI